jgi:hypothetical protein
MDTHTAQIVSLADRRAAKTGKQTAEATSAPPKPPRRKIKRGTVCGPFICEKPQGGWV